MNYFALAGAIFLGLWALYCLSHIALVAVGKGRWRSAWGFTMNAIPAAVCGTLAVWLFTVAIGQ